MKKELLLIAALALSACSRNPDPEYAPDADDATPAPAAPAAVAPAPVPDPAPEVARLSEEETYRLGREAVALLFANDMAALWPRFDADVQAQAQSAENFGNMVTQIFGQIGAEMNVVEEEVMTPPEQPGMSIYRRRSHYLAIGQDANLIVAFNPDGTIAGLNIQPAE